MASSTAWNCQLCVGSYKRLLDLVGHVKAVHSADVNLTYVCKVQGCLRTFKKTNTWYKHILQAHREEYYRKGSSLASCNEETTGSDEMDNLTSEVQENESFGASSSDLQESSTPEVSPTPMPEDVIAVKLLSIREKHHLSHAAIDEVVELVELACNQISAKALSSIQQCAEESGIASDFIQNLSQIFEALTSPLEFVGTIYKQQSFIDQNLPYVVSGGKV